MFQLCHLHIYALAYPFQLDVLAYFKHKRNYVLRKCDVIDENRLDFQILREKIAQRHVPIAKQHLGYHRFSCQLPDIK